jgi:hypothetical protein
LAKVRRHTGGRRLWSGGAAFMFSRIVYLFLKFRFHVNLGGLRPSWLLMIECVPNNLPAKKKKLRHSDMLMLGENWFPSFVGVQRTRKC